MKQLAGFLGIDMLGWERAAGDRLGAATLVAVGAWAVMAWNRFGLLVATAPRPGVRFVLIGLYAWLGLATAVWLLARLVPSRPRSDATRGSGPGGGPVPGWLESGRWPAEAAVSGGAVSGVGAGGVATGAPTEAAGRGERPSLAQLVQVVGLAHRPVLVVAIVVQVTALIAPLSALALPIAVLGFGIWMPAMLIGAVRWAFRLRAGPAAAIVAVPYLSWLATAGRFLSERVGHLL